MLLGLPDDINEEKPSFLQFKKKRFTDGRNDRRTDRPSYRDAWTHLKIVLSGPMVQEKALEFYNSYLMRNIH